MSDYISRDELLELYAPGPDCDKCSVPYPVVRQNILDMPAADVAPVVRCPQCVHHEDNGYQFCNKWEHFLPDDSAFFCAFGERKEDNT